MSSLQAQTPLDPLAAWAAVGETPHALQASGIGVATIPNTASFAFASPNPAVPGEALLERATAAPLRLTCRSTSRTSRSSADL
jgi:hypothetical protein